MLASSFIAEQDFVSFSLVKMSLVGHLARVAYAVWVQHHVWIITAAILLLYWISDMHLLN